MGKYITKRIIAMAITLFIIVSLSFFAIRLIPGDVAGEAAPPEIKEAMAKRYHLDRPVSEQYTIFMKNFLSFDFGESMTLYPRRPVFTIIKDKIPLTLQLNLFSLLFTLHFEMLFRIIEKKKKNTWIDHSISAMVIFNVSVPAFVFASLLQYFFAFKLNLFPILLDLDSTFSIQKFWSMILPILALSFGGIATITRYLRAELFEALNSDYMLLAKSKGLSQTQAVLRHAIRNSFIPLANVVIPMFMNILGGSMVVENIFGIPGIGSLTANSIQTSDYYLTIAVLFFYSIITLTSVLVVDISYGIIDPRIRIGGGKNNAE